MFNFKRSRSEVIKEIFAWLLLGGIICIAATSPYFIINIVKSFKTAKKYEKKKIYNAFYRLKKEGCVIIEERNEQIYISLTEKGKRKAGYLQIDNLKIKKPKTWDRKWRIVMFDIAQLKKLYREIFRGKIKELGFVSIQKSVWLCPFECKKEISILKDFLGLTDKELLLIITESADWDEKFKKQFNLNT
ncbi:MAG: phenylacetic acid degradation operon negative regulatory protein [Parcubacteria group bacterium Licking1014_1]|nr:MAG: phenylacetic acid degradation operon negative regulatory protein [Parcubacteria group bacterium Licking1014_1]